MANLDEPFLIFDQRISKFKMTAVGFEPTPFRTGALNQRLRPLGHAAFKQCINN